MSTRWAAVAVVTSLLVLPRPAQPGRLPQAFSGCPTAVDDSDPLAAAGAVAAWLYCGPGPEANVVLSRHGRQVLTRRTSRGVAHTPTSVLATVLLDPRAAPVVVYVVVLRSGDADSHRVVVTLFSRPDGGWTADDLAVLDG